MCIHIRSAAPAPRSERISQRPVAQHCPRRVVAPQRTRRQLPVHVPVQIRLPRQHPPKPSDRVLHSPSFGNPVPACAGMTALGARPAP